jgi:hypothetical protein
VRQNGSDAPTYAMLRSLFEVTFCSVVCLARHLNSRQVRSKRLPRIVKTGYGADLTFLDIARDRRDLR